MLVHYIICEFFLKIVKSTLQNKWLITTGLHKKKTSLWFNRIFQLYSQSIQGHVDITFLLSESISSVLAPLAPKAFEEKKIHLPANNLVMSQWGSWYIRRTI